MARTLLVATAFLALLLLTDPGALAQPCTARSGDPGVTAVFRAGTTPFTAADFSDAINGPAAIVTSDPSWLTSLPCDSGASWIKPTTGSSGLYAVRFPCQFLPCPAATPGLSAFLTFCFAADNNLGSATNEGLFMNGAPLVGTKLLGNFATNYTTQTTFTVNVTPYVNGTCDILYVFVENQAGPSGVIFSASLSYGFTGFPPPNLGLCTLGGANPPNQVPPMTSASFLDPLQRNDNGSSLTAIPLGFPFCFFGQEFTEVFINNNGNITFGAPWATSTGVPFPIVGPRMIAPFWADVDTRNTNTGHVWYRAVAPNLFVVTWERVGYYDMHADKCNTFQVLLSDGTHPLLGIGNNVCFCYGSMNWTTGDASFGTGGIGGQPAIVGINVGDGINAIEVGRFDQPGSLYDGPRGANDGVGWLQYQTMCFDICGKCQRGVPNRNDLTINGQYSGSGSGLCINVTTPSTLAFNISSSPGQLCTLMYSANCVCPGIATPCGQCFHLDLLSLGFILDGPGLFGQPDGFMTDASGNASVFLVLPPIPGGFCVCVQAIILDPASPCSFHLTQAHKVCFQ